ncbi:uncharacterized protein POLR1D isoform X1 [Phalacrocorax aristotelis]|uniref:uncharacterized protein POLR1D isoform X1 n=1 Tax=Phalacrocorax aristotelis TaxID=126867 RepID=UPI003F4B47DB
MVGAAGTQWGWQEPTGPVTPLLSPRGGTWGHTHPPPGAAAGARRGVAAARLAPPRSSPAGVLAVLCACPRRSAPPHPEPGLSGVWRRPSPEELGRRVGGEQQPPALAAPPWRRTQSWRGKLWKSYLKRQNVGEPELKQWELWVGVFHEDFWDFLSPLSEESWRRDAQTLETSSVRPPILHWHWIVEATRPMKKDLFCHLSLG